MSALDLTSTDPTIDLGNRVSSLIREGYSGQQIAEAVGESPERAMEALTAYAHRVLFGTAPAMPSPDCGVGSTTDGWCFVHGVFHPASSCSPEDAAGVSTEAEHHHDLVESGTTDTCDYCCKIFRCACGKSEVRHMASYGCPIGRGDVAA